MKSYDIAVIGAGPVGMTLALALAKSGYSVSLIEKHPFEQEPNNDVRRLALSWGSMQLLKSVGINQQLHQAQPITSISVRQAGSVVSGEFCSSEHGIEYFAIAVAFSTLKQTLQKAIAQSSDIDLLCPFEAEKLYQQRDSIRLHDKERSICASLAIVVDGSNSQTLNRLGITSKKYQYEQNASIAQVTLAYPLQGKACEVFAKKNTFVLVPHQGREATLIQIAPLYQDFCSMKHINKAFLGLAPEITGIKILGSFPLVGTQANEVLRPRCLVLGNAARTMHPLLAQGLNLAFAQTSLLIRSLKDHKDPGNWQLLRSYVKQAESLGNSTALAVDVVRRISELGIPMAPAFSLMNLFLPVRDRVVDFASGYSAQRA